MKCKHVFKGHAHGVVCTLCGLSMTHEEYVKNTSKKTDNKTDKNKEKDE